jgi:putative component of membrane protein insertase Oxa1/YidC/SpoIIIJ protein YidD
MLSRLALAAIGGYQRHFSPRKGYACAHRVAHGGTGCSGYAKAAIADLGLLRSIPAIRQRFADCRDAAEELRDAKRKREKDKWYDHCSAGCDCSPGCDLPLRGCGKKADMTPDCDCTPDCCSF